MTLAISALYLAALMVGCSDEPVAVYPTPEVSDEVAPPVPIVLESPPNRDLVYTEERAPCRDYRPERRALFGELHVHTALSFDAVAGRINTRPADAYAFARGESIAFFPQDENGDPGGEIALEQPLDFAAVTDHGEFLGERELCVNAESPAYNGEFCRKYRGHEFTGTLMLASVIAQFQPRRNPLLCGEDGRLCREWVKSPWEEILAAAEAAYDRSEDCQFTSFVGYEYTGTPGNSNYHRNVIFRNGSVPDAPVSFIEAPMDYLLWQQLDAKCEPLAQCDYMTIPHNSNMSNGRLLTPYADMQLTRGNRLDYARARLKRERLMEIFQHKGASECMNGFAGVLGAPDELCDVEQVRAIGAVSTARDFRLEGTEIIHLPPEDSETVECAEGEKGALGMFAGGCVSRNDFLRTALITGMEEQRDIGLNPVKLGVIASTDGHAGVPGAVNENDWRGTVSGEMTTAKRLKPGTLPSGIKGNPGGLAGVWAVENSRDAIFDALERRETFGTSGPRITVRFFAAWDFADNSCELSDMPAKAYATGVPMGDDLSSQPGLDSKPVFILAAHRDPANGSAPLQQLQLIKGWVDAAGRRHTRVFTVAGDGNNDAGVNMQTGERYGDGFDRLCQVYRDVEFDPKVPAYYYLRAVENPSARWSFYDCLRLETESLASETRPEICADPGRHVIREMAWSSPIWYTP